MSQQVTFPIGTSSQATRVAKYLRICTIRFGALVVASLAASLVIYRTNCFPNPFSLTTSVAFSAELTKAGKYGVQHSESEQMFENHKTWWRNWSVSAGLCPPLLSYNVSRNCPNPGIDHMVMILEHWPPTKNPTEEGCVLDVRFFTTSDIRRLHDNW